LGRDLSSSTPPNIVSRELFHHHRSKHWRSSQERVLGCCAGRRGVPERGARERGSRGEEPPLPLGPSAPLLLCSAACFWSLHVRLMRGETSCGMRDIIRYRASRLTPHASHIRQDSRGILASRPKR
jgi:hypothetical protein